MRSARPARLVAGLALVVLASCSRGFHGRAMQPSLPAPDLPLYGADSSVVTFRETGGRLTLTAFGYTSCPDVCPTTLSGWRAVRTALGADTVHVRFVFVSGDWRHDQPQHTAEFARLFDPSFVGVTADSTTIHQLLAPFQAQVGYGASANGGPVGFAHTDYNYVVDEKGRIALWYPFKSPPKDVAADLRRLVREHRLGSDRR